MENSFKSNKLKKFLWVASILVAYAGLIRFTCFIFEESLQIQSFTASIYMNSKDWVGLDNHIQFMEKSQTVAEFWVKSFGWGNPVMWPAFLSYMESNDAYIKSLKRKVELEIG